MFCPKIGEILYNVYCLQELIKIKNTLKKEKGIIKQIVFLKEFTPIILEHKRESTKNKTTNKIGDLGKYIVFSKYEKLAIEKQIEQIRKRINIIPIINLKVLPPKYSEMSIISEEEKFLKSMLRMYPNIRATIDSKSKFAMQPVPTVDIKFCAEYSFI